MKQISTLSIEQLPRFSKAAQELLNYYFSRAPLPINTLSMRMQPINLSVARTHHHQVTQVTLGLKNNGSQETCVLRLVHDQCPINWQAYEGDTQRMAWAIGHDELLQGLAHVINGDLDVLSIEDNDDLNPEDETLEHIALGINLKDKEGKSVCNGSIHAHHNQFREPSDHWPADRLLPWTTVPATLPICLPSCDVQRDELNRLEIGGLIRLDVDISNLDDYLHVQTQGLSRVAFDQLLLVNLTNNNQRVRIETANPHQ